MAAKPPKRRRPPRANPNRIARAAADLLLAHSGMQSKSCPRCQRPHRCLRKRSRTLQRPAREVQSARVMRRRRWLPAASRFGRRNRADPHPSTAPAPAIAPHRPHSPRHRDRGVRGQSSPADHQCAADARAGAIPSAAARHPITARAARRTAERIRCKANFCPIRIAGNEYRAR